MHDLQTKLIRGVSWSALQRLGSQAIQGVVFLLLARLLEPKDFGLLSLALVYVTFLQIFVEQGVGDAVIQRREIDADYLDTAFWTNLLGGLAFCAVGWAVADAVAGVFGQPELAPILRWLSLLFPLTALTIVPQCLLRREMRFKTLATCSLVQFSTSGAVAVAMAFRGAGVWSLVGQQFAAAGAGAAALWFATDWRPRFTVCRRCFKELLWFGSNVTGVNVLNLINRQADNLIIGYFLGPVALGYYAIAYQILVNVANLFVGTINSVALPLFARLQHDRAEFQLAIFRLTSLTCVISAPIFYGLSALAPEAISVCFGDKWAASVPSLQVLCLVGLLYAGFYFHGSILTALGKPQWNLFLNALQAAGNCAAFLVGVRWGIVGVATAYVVRAYLMAPIHLWVLRREAGVDVRIYVKQFLPAGVSSVVMMLGIAGFKSASVDTLSAASELALAVCAGGALYLAMILVLQPKLRGQFGALANRLARRDRPVHEPAIP